MLAITKLEQNRRTVGKKQQVSRAAIQAEYGHVRRPGHVLDIDWIGCQYRWHILAPHGSTHIVETCEIEGVLIFFGEVFNQLGSPSRYFLVGQVWVNERQLVDSKSHSIFKCWDEYIGCSSQRDK